MNKAFLTAYQATKEIEGGYVNHQSDRGGETYAGIARRFHPNSPIWAIVDDYKKMPGFPKNMLNDVRLKQLIQQFYYENFWLPNKLSEIPDIKITNKLYDMGVNLGIKIAAMLFQKALNITNRNQRDYKDITVDGVIGNSTLQAYIANKDKDVLFKVVNVLHGNRYIEISERNKTQEVFINGWFSNRIAMAESQLPASNLA
ncbi:MAG: hypothetical protein LC105_06230 [Chitinophagales bacterium]|nr:hypothetical protein [Chitinophagales bacterium]